MPIKLTYDMMKDSRIKEALSKLSNHGFRDQILSYSIAKLIRKWDQEYTIFMELGLKIIKKHALLDEKGGLKTPEGRPHGSFEIPQANLESYNAEMKSLAGVEFEIPVNQIRLDQLSDVALSPVELIALEPILLPESIETETKPE